MNIIMDIVKHGCYAGKKELFLTPKEWEILRLIKDGDGKVFSRPEIARVVFGKKKTTLRTVDQHVARLRKKIGKDCPITTITLYGYKYSA